MLTKCAKSLTRHYVRHFKWNSLIFYFRGIRFVLECFNQSSPIFIFGDHSSFFVILLFLLSESFWLLNFFTITILSRNNNDNDNDNNNNSNHFVKVHEHIITPDVLKKRTEGGFAGLFFPKAMHLKEKLVMSVLFVIRNFGTTIHALYNHYFTKFLLNYEVKLTQNYLLTLLYNKIDDSITKILLLLSLKTRYKCYITKFCKIWLLFFKQNWQVLKR